MNMTFSTDLSFGESGVDVGFDKYMCKTPGMKI